jgi:lipoprotein-anchoring transpeptidase ErfK/SrfK
MGVAVMRPHLVSLLAFVLLAGSASAASLDMQAVNGAQWRKAPDKSGVSPLLIKAQVLLDRAHFSPGEIDGKNGENLKKALTAFAAAQGAKPADKLTEELWQKLAATGADPVLIEYTTSDDDFRGPFLDKVPKKLEEMKDLSAIGYGSVREKLAEKFHMSQDLLKALNPKQKFEKAGERIVVANVGPPQLSEKATRIEIDKTAQVLKLFARDQRLLATYPATVGSVERPAPSGKMTVKSVTENPTYTYNPKYAFKGVRAAERFTVKAGPNGPVGLVWIGLSSGEGYGIHGTADPSKVSKSDSHGCVRLTNWDALQVASVVSKGTPVEFSGDEQSRQSPTEGKRRQRRR